MDDPRKAPKSLCNNRNHEGLFDLARKIASGDPVWPCTHGQDVAFLALTIHKRLSGIVNGDAHKSPQFVIWSAEHGSYWAPDSSGYVSNVADAGRYSFDEAKAICKDTAYPEAGTSPDELMLLAPECLDMDVIIYELLKEHKRLKRLVIDCSGWNWLSDDAEETIPKELRASVQELDRELASESTSEEQAS